MGIFSAIMDKLRHRGAAPTQASNQQTGAPGTQSAGGTQASGNQPQQRGSQPVQAGSQTGAQAAPQSALSDVDVEAVLSQMASQKGGGGNYKTSIVDLLKLLDLDSSLNARKELAEELGVNAGAHGSAEQNIALHKAVMRKIAENGGKVPASMRD
jgi:hypothetical protein